MQPYTYRRRLAGMPGPAAVSAPGFFHSLLHAPISSAIALAMVIFAAGSAASLTYAASSEISDMSRISEDIKPKMQNQRGMMPPRQQDFSLDSSLSSAQPLYTLSASVMDFDDETQMWNASLDIMFPDDALPAGSVLAGKKVVAQTVSPQDSIVTPYMFKPGSRVELTVVNKTKKGLEKIAMIALTFPPMPEENTDQPTFDQGGKMMPPQIMPLASSTPGTGMGRPQQPEKGMPPRPQPTLIPGSQPTR